MSQTVTIPKNEYRRLKEIAKRFKTVRNAIAGELFPELPTEDIKEYAHPQRISRSLKNALKEYPIG